MTGFLLLLVRHGYTVLGLLVGFGAVGIPMPVTLALITAGAASARHFLRPEIALLVSVSALLLGDSILYWLGRHTGWWLLGMLCRVTLNPEACILRSAESFYRRGKVALLIAKFMPGIGVLAAPLAGSMKMGWGQFLRLDLLGACLYAGVYGGLGFLFGDVISTVSTGMRNAGAVLVAVGVGGYIGFRAYLYWKQRKELPVQRISVQELAGKIAAAKCQPPLIVDVRSHGYYDAGALRIKGSIRIEPNNLLSAAEKLPRDREIYLYCT
jgi:membrane protein DedA with SNARE-associated domain